MQRNGSTDLISEAGGVGKIGPGDVGVMKNNTPAGFETTVAVEGAAASADAVEASTVESGNTEGRITVANTRSRLFAGGLKFADGTPLDDVFRLGGHANPAP